MPYWELIRRTRVMAGYSLRRWARACGVSLTAAVALRRWARACGVSLTAAVAWEAGRYCPDYQHRETIAGLASTGACRYEHERQLARRQLAAQLHAAAADHAKTYARYAKRAA